MAEGDQTFKILIEVKADTSGSDKAKEGLDKAKDSALELNAALELVKKGFEVLKTIVEIPIKIGETIVELAKDFDQVYQSQARLEVGLRSVGDTSGSLKRHLEELGEELVRNSRYDDEAIRTGEARALTYQQQGEDLDKLLQISVDVGAYYNLGFPEAIGKVEQALQTGFLQTGQRSRIELSKLTEEGGRSSEVFAGLTSRYGGFAKALAEGGAGSIFQLTKAFDEFKQTLGKVIVDTPEFTALVNTLTEGLTQLGGVISGSEHAFTDLFGKVLRDSIDLTIKGLVGVAGWLRAIGAEVVATGKAIENSLLGSFIGFETEEHKLIDRVRSLKDDIKNNQDFLASYPNSSSADGYRNSLKSFQDDLIDAEKRLADIKVNPFEEADKTYKTLFNDWDSFQKYVQDHPLILFDKDAFLKAQQEFLLQARANQRDAITVGSGGERKRTTPQDEEIAAGIRAGSYAELLENIQKVNQAYEHGAITLVQVRAETDRLTAAGTKDAQTIAHGFDQAWAQTRLAAENNAKAIVDIWNVGINTISDGLAQLVTTGKANFRDLANAAIAEINRIIIRMLVLKAIEGIGNAFAGGSGDTLGLSPAVGTGAGTPGSNAVGAPVQGLAGGGPVIGGRTYLVGERGPELFTAKTSGTITPNHRIGDAASSPKVEVFVLQHPQEFENYLNSPRGERTIRKVINRGRVTAGS